MDSKDQKWTLICCAIIAGCLAGYAIFCQHQGTMAAVANGYHHTTLPGESGAFWTR
jgi:hypothetical protein